jgi:NADH-quinone oxidoreductase subunit H
MSGWSSNSKYSFLGALRAAMQVIAYEICFGLSLLCVFLFTESLNLSDIVFYQLVYGMLCWPLLPMLVVFFITALAETNRHPFDLPEAEAELVSGYNTEYSAMVFALFFLGEYLSILAMSAITVILFFGGWSCPWSSNPIDEIFDSIHPIIYFSGKLFLVSTMFVVVRGVLPRFRFDQLMALGWKTLIPGTIAFTLVTSIVVYLCKFS